MDISKRLETIANLSSGKVVADIGCDHGYVACLTVQNGAQKAYACDLRKGPVENAEKTIKAMGLQDKVFVRMQNGIENLPEDVDEVIIAGMGGTLIAAILEKLDEPQYENVKTLLLSPHKDASFLRKWLYDHNLCIKEEQWIEDGHFYPIMKVVRENKEPMSDAELYFGKNVKQSPAYSRMLEKKIQKLQTILQQMPKEKSQAIQREYDAAIAAKEKTENTNTK
jgi:tRNA (adenine22-N1)-methyltransferase